MVLPDPLGLFFPDTGGDPHLVLEEEMAVKRYGSAILCDKADHVVDKRFFWEMEEHLERLQEILLQIFREPAFSSMDILRR